MKSSSKGIHFHLLNRSNRCSSFLSLRISRKKRSKEKSLSFSMIKVKKNLLNNSFLNNYLRRHNLPKITSKVAHMSLFSKWTSFLLLMRVALWKTYSVKRTLKRGTLWNNSKSLTKWRLKNWHKTTKRMINGSVTRKRNEVKSFLRGNTKRTHKWQISLSKWAKLSCLIIHQTTMLIPVSQTNS